MAPRAVFLESDAMSRRALPILVLLLAGVGSGSVWWHHVTRPEYRFQRGREAVQRGDWDEAETFAARLDASGAANLARLLRGESLLTQDRPTEALRELNQVRDEG